MYNLNCINKTNLSVAIFTTDDSLWGYYLKIVYLHYLKIHYLKIRVPTLSEDTCIYIIWRYIIWSYVYRHLLFIQILSTLHFIIIIIVRIIKVSVINFYIYVIKDCRRYLSSVLPIYRTLNATLIYIFGVREMSYLGRICEICLEALR